MDQSQQCRVPEELLFPLKKQQRGYLIRGGRNGEEAGNNHSAKGSLSQLFSVLPPQREDETHLKNIRKLN